MYLAMTNGFEQVRIEQRKNRRSLMDVLRCGIKQVKAILQQGRETYRKRKLAYQKEKELLKEELQYSKEEQKITKKKREGILETQKQLEDLLAIKRDMTSEEPTEKGLTKTQAQAILKMFSSTSVPSQKEMIIRTIKQKINRFKEEDTSRYSFNDYFMRIEDIDAVITKYCRTNDRILLKYLAVLADVKRVYLLRMQKQIIFFVNKFNNQLTQFIPFCESNCVLKEDIALMNSNYEYIVSKIQKYYFGNEAFGDLFISIREKIIKINKILMKKEKMQVQESTQFQKQKVA